MKYIEYILVVLIVVAVWHYVDSSSEQIEVSGTVSPGSYYLPNYNGVITVTNTGSATIEFE